jgi:Phosphatidylserine/phosphatidylglycerophosphate/cardiolipin synthases and related enzymes
LQPKQKRWKYKLLRYRQYVQGYVIYIAMVAVFLLVCSYYVFTQLGIVTSLAIGIFAGVALFYLSFTQRTIMDRFSWFIMIIIMPFFGAFLFWFLGISQIQPNSYREKREHDDYYLTRYNDKITIPYNKWPELLLFTKSSNFSVGNHYQYLVGPAIYNRILSDIKAAKHHVHIEIYISRYDETTKAIFDELIKKAEQGVEVRFLADVFGHTMFKSKFIEKMTDAGIEFVFFNQKSRTYSDHFHVNHRKNIVIDGKIAYTGGVNFGNEYVNGYPKKSLKWYDMMARIEGNVVQAIQAMFLTDWCFSIKEDTNEMMQRMEFFPQKFIDTPNEEQPLTQFLADGPDRDDVFTKNLLRMLIVRANKRVFITTPYLIPPADLLSDLKLAALSGIDVRIIIPDVPDKKFVYKCTESYLETLLEAGVKIYKMKEHFIHSKIVLIDDDISIFGTVNFDMRSLFLNFEEMIIQYNDQKSNKELLKIYKTAEKQSRPIDYKIWLNRGRKQKILETITRIFAPLM